MPVTFGFGGGMDYRCRPDTKLGFALAGGGTNWICVRTSVVAAAMRSRAGVYAKAHRGPAYLSAALAFANHWFTHATHLGARRSTAGKLPGQSYGGRLEAGYRYGLP